MMRVELAIDIENSLVPMADSITVSDNYVVNSPRQIVVQKQNTGGQTVLIERV